MLRLPSPALAALAAAAVAVGATPSPVHAQDARQTPHAPDDELDAVLPLLNTAVVRRTGRSGETSPTASRRRT